MEFQLLPVPLLVTLLLFFTSNATELETVYDIDGHTVIPGQEYYILPVIRGRGGGLTMLQHNHQCPLYVGQENSEVDRGLPLIFRPVNPTDTAVTLSTDMNIEFSASTICVQSTAWRLGDVEGSNNTRYVVTGGVIGTPGIQTVSNWFKVEKSKTIDYKLVFCPSVCETCKVVCGDVGVFIEGGKRLLGLNGNTFPVMFKKVDSEF